MWLVVSKKELAKELEQIRTSIQDKENKIEVLKNKLESNSLKLATIEGLILSKSQVSDKVSSKSLGTIETTMVKKIQKNKKSIIMSEILKLLSDNTTTDIFNKIVTERKLCSKASFFRYLSSIKNQKILTNTTGSNK